MPQHFVAPPQWEWYIVWYFFLGGLSGGAYVIGTLLRLLGARRDESAARLAFLIAFPTMFLCPIFLTLDLGLPFRFWHMFVDSRTFGLNFKYWSPMSMGAWALFFFGAFATVSFLEVLALENTLRHPLARRFAQGLSGTVGRLVMVVGALFALFLMGYTGVLLSVSNQPIWSDTWVLGALFLASGLSVATAAIALLTRWRASAGPTAPKLFRADRYFVLLELALLIAFFVTLGSTGARMVHGRDAVLWVIVLAGILAPLAVHWRPSHRVSGAVVLASGLALVGGLALRIVVVFGAQG
jgi:formate-dependent nitrite reductase membrane component NrfD